MVESLFHVDLALLQSRPFFMCGNPKGVKFKRKLTAIDFSFHLASISWSILEKGGSTPVLASHKKGILPLKRAFLGESQRLVRRLSNQISSFSLKHLHFFFTYVQLTATLHYRIHGLLRTELLVRNAFQSAFSFESSNENIAFP